MSSMILAMMIGASLLVGGIVLFAMLWGLKSGQFDEESRFLNATMFDSEDELKDAIIMEKRRKKGKKGIAKKANEEYS